MKRIAVINEISFNRAPEGFVEANCAAQVNFADNSWPDARVWHSNP